MNVSYLKFLRVVIDTAFYLLIVAILMIIAMPVISALYPTSAIQISMPIPIQLAHGGVFNENGLAGTISNSNYSEFSVRLADFRALRQNVLLYGSMLLAFIVLTGLLLILIYQLRQLIRAIGTPAVFSQANVVRIRRIGGLLIAFELVKPIMWLIIRPQVFMLMANNHISYAEENLSFGLSDWGLAGLLILGLAEVFRSGNQLQRESELTI